MKKHFQPPGFWQNGIR